MHDVAETDNIIFASIVKHNGKLRTSHIEEDSKLALGRTVPMGFVVKVPKGARSGLFRLCNDSICTLFNDFGNKAPICILFNDFNYKAISRCTLSKRLEEYRKHGMIKTYYQGLTKYHEYVSGEVKQPCSLLAPMRMKTNGGRFFNLILFEKLQL